MKQVLISLIFFVVLPGVGLGQAGADSVAVTKQVDSLILVSRGLTDKKDFEKAMEVNAVAEKLALEKFGEESAPYAKACNNHGRVLFDKRDYPEAEKWYLEAAAIRGRVLGKGNPYYAGSLQSLVYLYRAMARYKEAEPIALEALAIREKALGKEHSDYMATLISLGMLYKQMGNYEKALPLLMEAKTIKERTVGKESYDYGRSLNQLATLYTEMGNFEQAEPYFLEARDIWGKISGKEHPDYAACLSNLNVLYTYMGRFEKAELLGIEAIRIKEKVLGKEHPEYAQGLDALAALYDNMGNYEKAELLYLESKEIKEKRFGVNHPEYALTLGNLAVLYDHVGNFKKAEPLFIEVMAIHAKTLGKEHPHYAWGVHNLAENYRKQGKYRNSEPLFLESKAVREKTLGKENPDFAWSLNVLATLYTDMRLYEKAEALHLEAKAIQEKVLSKDHPNYATNIENLANMYAAKGDYTKAEVFYLESKSIREKAILYETPNYTAGLNHLANLYFDTHRPHQAASFYDSSSIIQQTLLSRALQHLSEREIEGYVHLFSGTQAQILSLAQGVPAATSTAYNNTLFYKGFLLNAYNQVKRLALSDSTTTEKFNLLKSYERRLAAEYAKPISERKNVAELEEKANTLEKDLARSVAGYGQAMQQVKWQEVQQNLKPGEAAIEFVHYQFYSKKLSDNTLYAAMLLRSGWSQARMIPLFEQRQIQPLLAAANTAAAAGQLYATRGVLRGRKTHAGQPKTRAARGKTESGEGIVIPSQKTTSLYQLIWAPMDSLLHDVSTVYFAPSGLLHRLDLAAIAVPGTDQILADKYALVQLGSTRQLVVHEQPTTNAQTAALFGGIKYDLEKPAEMPDSVVQTKPSFDVAALRSALGSQGGDTWNYLPGTEKEVKNAAKTLGTAGYSVHTLSGYEGSEAAFKMMGKTGHPAPRVLHIATHGFFFPDPKDTVQQRGAFSDREPVFKTSDNPLLRSGLVLAGANPAWAGGKTPEGQEDGILTAYEISQMNLSGTELVVLSACETGLGDVEDNEGVYGLKRSFKIAGAKYLIMSLWQVPDQQTQELMSAFYKNWLEEKMAIPKAFSEAQQRMRKRYGDAFFWAGFVLVE